jgi:hypothetical protein
LRGRVCGGLGSLLTALHANDYRQSGRAFDILLGWNFLQFFTLEMSSRTDKVLLRLTEPLT